MDRKVTEKPVHPETFKSVYFLMCVGFPALLTDSESSTKTILSFMFLIVERIPEINHPLLLCWKYPNMMSCCLSLAGYPLG